MISLSLSKNPEGQDWRDPSGPSQGSKVLYLPQNIVVRFEYPKDLSEDVFGAVELIVMVVAPGLAQQGIFVRLARINTVETNILISLYQEKMALIKEYEFSQQALGDMFRKARSRLYAREGRIDLKNKVLEEIEKAFQDPDLGEETNL